MATDAGLAAWATSRVFELMHGAIGRDDILQLVEYTVGLTTKEEASQNLLDILGESPESIDFIQEFVQRRFPERQNLGAWSDTAVKARREQQEKALAAQKLREAEAELVRRQNNQQLEEQQSDFLRQAQYDQYHSGVAPSAASRQSVKSKGKKKGKPLASLEKVGSAPAGFSGRPVCECMATTHALITNCLSCGKIICEFEGAGPCPTCGSPVESAEQQRALLMQRRLDSLAVSAEGADGKSFNDTVAANLDRAEQVLMVAEARKERLLEFDRNSVARTHVNDTASDYVAESQDKWLTPEERALAVKKMQALQKLQEEHKARRVITLDLENKRVLVDTDADAKLAAATAAIDNLKLTPAKPAASHSQLASSNKSADAELDGHSTGAFRNPTLAVPAPKFISRNKSTAAATAKAPTLKMGRQKMSQKELLRLQDDILQEELSYSFAGPISIPGRDFEEPTCG